MKRPHYSRNGLVGLFVAVLIVLTAIFTLHSAATIAQTTSSKRSAGDESASHARWKNGELVAPLPTDPVRRAEAIRLAKESRRALESSPSFTPGGATMTIGPVIQPNPVREGTPARVSPKLRGRTAHRIQTPLLPPLEPFQPTAEQLREAQSVPRIVVESSQAPALGGVMGSFDAIDYTGWTPASPDIAVGPAHILVATADEFGVYDKCGEWISGGVFGDIFPISPDFIYDEPRVVYDDWNGRWIMAYAANDFTNDVSYIKIVTSYTADLEDGWNCFYHLSAADAGSFVDNMHMAVDPEGIYFTFNQHDFNTSTFEWAKIVALDKEDIYGCYATTPVHWTGLTNGDGSTVVAIRPAQMRSYNGAMHFLNNKYEGGDSFTMWAIEDPFDSTPILSKASITVAPYTSPPKMIQPNGTYVSSGDCRVADVVYYDHTVHAVFTKNATIEGVSELSLIKFEAFPAALEGNVVIVSPGFFWAYPALDVDEHGRIGITFATCSQSSSRYLSVGFLIYDWNQLAILDSGTLVYGLADFTLGGSGTIGSPYRWGNWSGCAIDPVDDRTFWMCGAYASNDPTPSWTTRVGAASGMSQSNLIIEPSALVTGGEPGGPFVKEVLPVTLSNTGETNLHWRIDDFPAWLTPSAMTGEIQRGGSQAISLFLNEAARMLSVGVFVDQVLFSNCTGTVSGTCSVNLTIVEPFSCPTAAISLVPEIGDAIALSGGNEYSVFITALEDIDICAIGLMLVNPEPETITCTVYEADGTTRGPLVYSNSQLAVQSSDETYLVPMVTSLQACQDYEIVFAHPVSIKHASYDENDFSYPFDANGLIRVQQSATNGVVVDVKHPGIVIYGVSACDQLSSHSIDLYPRAAEHTETSTDASQGLFVTARENLYLCSVEFEADLVRDRWLSARVFEANGNVRGRLIAEGHTPVQAGGQVLHEIPIHAFIKAGQDYNISVDISEKGYWPAIAEGEVTLPYTVDGDIEVRKGELLGAESPNLPHIVLNWEDIAVRGAPFDLAKSADGIPPPFPRSGAINHGVFVQPTTMQKVYSVGVYGDIPEGETVTARIYRVTFLGARGMLVTEGTIESGGSGPRWHDVPVAGSWGPLSRFDISIVCSNSNEVRYWLDNTGMPYAPYGGLIEVLDSETSGATGSNELIHLRVNACGDNPTAIGDEPVRFTPFTLDAPVPNPASGLVKFRYSLDAPGAADLEIYDVAGRRVAPVFSGQWVQAGSGSVEFDASNLASGVYFLRLSTGGKSVARKIVVAR